MKHTVALYVHRDGAEPVMMDLNVGVDVHMLELALSQLFGSVGDDRLWAVIDGDQVAIAEADPHHQPIGSLLAPDQLHNVIFSETRPPIRGR